MNCRICGNYMPYHEDRATLHLILPSTDLRITDICETCMGKIWDFLAALGLKMAAKSGKEAVK